MQGKKPCIFHFSAKFMVKINKKVYFDKKFCVFLKNTIAFLICELYNGGNIAKGINIWEKNYIT